MKSRADTIAAIATPPGSGGVAIVRVSGAEAATIVGSIFQRRRGGGIDVPRKVYVGRLLDHPGGNVVDEVLVFAMAAPQSYTGEDVVEIQCHGGSVVSQRVLESVCTAGARPAEPGEFSKRAFLNGRIDLAQAEAVADLIAARSEAGRRMAWSQLEGQLSTRVHVLRDSIVSARALCEAALDFSDEDLPDLTIEDLGREISKVRCELESLVLGFDRARIRYEGARVAVVGRPNVGKSSLLKALLGRERALVTPVAGTTRDVIEASIAIDGAPVVLMDTAGLRGAPDAIEAMGIRRTERAIEDAACVVAVFDQSSEIALDDRLVVDAMRGRRVVAVLNKADLPSRLTATDIRQILGDVSIVVTSATNGDGVADVARAIGETLFRSGPDDDDEVVIFRARHRDAARQAMVDLQRAEASLASGRPLELVASDLSAATSALDAITGEISNEDVLDRVFADFCIGK
jgi:tRNA modification GTPase